MPLLAEFLVAFALAYVPPIPPPQRRITTTPFTGWRSALRWLRWPFRRRLFGRRLQSGGRARDHDDGPGECLQRMDSHRRQPRWRSGRRHHVQYPESRRREAQRRRAVRRNKVAASSLSKLDARIARTSIGFGDYFDTAMTCAWILPSTSPEPKRAAIASLRRDRWLRRGGMHHALRFRRAAAFPDSRRSPGREATRRGCASRASRSRLFFEAGGGEVGHDVCN